MPAPAPSPMTPAFTTLLNLPTEILLLVAGYVDAEGDALSLSGTCRRLHSVMAESVFSYAVEQRRDMSALQHAAFRGCGEMAKQMLSCGRGNTFTPSTLYPVQSPYSPFTLAIMQNHVHVVRAFIENGVDINARQQGEDSPVQTALDMWMNTLNHPELASGVVEESGQNVPEVLRLLLDQQPDLSRANDIVGNTVLHHTIFFRTTEAMQLLLEYGALVDVKTCHGQTALHLACGNGYFQHVWILICYGADVNARDNWGRTPLSRAVQGRHEPVAALLRENGALNEGNK